MSIVQDWTTAADIETKAKELLTKVSDGKIEASDAYYEIARFIENATMSDEARSNAIVGVDKLFTDTLDCTIEELM